MKQFFIAASLVHLAACMPYEPGPPPCETARFEDVSDLETRDLSTGLVWFRTDFEYCTDVYDAVAACAAAGQGMRPATAEEINTMRSAVPATCATSMPSNMSSVRLRGIITAEGECLDLAAGAPCDAKGPAVVRSTLCVR
jgi:hypothetical protein